MPARAVIAVLVFLCALVLPVATAQADHWQDPEQQQSWWPEQVTDPAADPATTDPAIDDPATTEDPAADGPLEPPIVAPLPTQAEPEPPAPQVELVRTAMVPGRTAKLRTDGRAAIPRGAPRTIRTLIAAMNRIVGKPYKWGGGHARLLDRGYDCSGAVSYGLIGAGLLRSPQASGTLARWGAKGAGRWVTVYANRGHVYLEVAGLRLDTSPVADLFGGRNGVRWRSLIGKRRGFAVRHPVGY